MLKTTLKRLRFWLRSKPFFYDKETATGMAVERYYPMRDIVRVRVSRFGYVEKRAFMSRDLYLRAITR